MLKALEGLQYGFETPKSYQTSVINHRIVKLSISKHTKLEPFHTASINALDLDKVDERYLLSGSKSGALCIHDLQNSTGMASYKPKIVGEIPRHVRYSHKYSISTVQWYPFDTGMFLSSGMDHILKIWDTNAMKPAEKFNLQIKINSHHMSPIATQHSLIALAMENPHAVLLDPRSGSYCHQLRGHKTALSCVRWSPICEYLIATGGVDSKILLWDIRSAKGYLSCLDQHNGEAQGNCKDLITSHNGAIDSMRFTNDGLHLVSFGSDSKVRLWDVALSLNTLVNYGVVPNSQSYVRRPMIEVCCNTNPPVIFVPSSNQIICLDLFHGYKISQLVAHFNRVNCCVYRSSTNQLYSGGNDMTILLWTPDSEKESLELKEKLNADRDTGLAHDSDAWSSSDNEM